MHLSPLHKGSVCNARQLLGRVLYLPIPPYSMSRVLLVIAAVGGTVGAPASETAAEALKSGIANVNDTWIFVDADKLEHQRQALLPVVVNTWTGDFARATERAWGVVSAPQPTDSTVLDAIEEGCNTCEDIQCGGSVGYGGHPDSSGEVTLDSMVMYGPTHSVGSVGCIRWIKNAATVARAVMEHTEHTMLVGEGATAFAKMMGVREEDLSTASSRQSHESWVVDACQPNYYRHFDGAENSCPPYMPPRVEREQGGGDVQKSNDPARLMISEDNHDTIGMVVVDVDGDMACGTTTNGAANKIAGRVGDSPVVGAGCYVDNDVGGAAATGDGDIMMRFLPSFHAVESMRNGASPTDACTEALCRIGRFYPTYGGALICVNKAGEHGAARHGLGFSYSYQGPGDDRPQIGHAVTADEQTCSLIKSMARGDGLVRHRGDAQTVSEEER